MTEASKTITFLITGIVALAAAFMVTSAPSEFDPAEEVGKMLNEFSADKPKSLRIVKPAPNGLELETFEVAEKNGTWIIPSKQDYPADATRQMAAAATALINREILRVQAETAEDHAALGVLNPSDADLDGDVEDVGTRVTMADVNENTLLDMIIGREVKDFPGQHYVRNVNQDVVYVVDLDPQPLSTAFSDWIEDDLLKIDPFNIQQVFINDYSAELTPFVVGGRIEMRIDWDRRSQMTLDYSNEDAKWKPVKLLKFTDPQSDPEPIELGENQELNQDKLRELRNGLDDLLIVDIERKPAGLSADLKAGDDFLNNSNEQSLNNLVMRGFAPVPLEQGGPLEILSSQGEMICTMKNGVEYVLRFGNPASDEGLDPADAESDAKLNRYLFVSVRYNEDAVQEPDYADLPPLPQGVEEPADDTDENAEGAEDAAASESEDAAATTEGQEEEEEEEEAAETDAEATETAESADSTEGEAAAADEAAEGADEAASETDKPAAPDGEAILAERKAIEKENERLKAEYEETLAEGRQQVEELNARFGDWYYVISEDVFQQIHLSLDDVIQEKPQEDAEGAAAVGDDDPLAGLPDLPLVDDAGGADEEAASNVQGESEE